MRILVTNDDGVHAPGIAALAEAAHATGHQVIVVAPMVDSSGAGAAVGPVHQREGVEYASYPMEAIPDVPVYGIDGPPALAVILACVGGFGPRPDLVLSGINLGANVGRSALHSGTIGAALTAAHFGLRSLAVSIRYCDDPVPWQTPATLAGELVPVLEAAAPGTVLNLNVPNVALDELLGIRRGRLGSGGTIRSAVVEEPDHLHLPDGDGHPPIMSLPSSPSGMLRLDLAMPGSDRNADPDSDAGLVAAGFASLTPLVGVREAGAEGDKVMTAVADARILQRVRNLA
ncbi:MAG: 5'/3'-nucleotidase SurE [Acidimicrobiales bacterium]